MRLGDEQNEWWCMVVLLFDIVDIVVEQQN